MAHEGTIQVNEAKVGMISTQYETFTMRESETIQERYTKFTDFTNK